MQEEEKILRFKREDLTNYATQYMVKLGVPEEDAGVVADVLIESDLRGIDSHGIIRIYSYYGIRLENKYMNPVTDKKILAETDTTAVYDGGNGLGQVVSVEAMKRCIDKAKKHNIAVATVKNSNHYGIAPSCCRHATCLPVVQDHLGAVAGSGYLVSTRPLVGSAYPCPDSHAELVSRNLGEQSPHQRSH